MIAMGIPADVTIRMVLSTIASAITDTITQAITGACFSFRGSGINRSSISVQVYDIEKTDTGDFIFNIDGYGTCEGPYRIFSTQIGKTVFLSEEKAKAYC